MAQQVSPVARSRLHRFGAGKAKPTAAAAPRQQLKRKSAAVEEQELQKAIGRSSLFK